MSGAIKRSQSRKNQTWIPVQEGLFDFPPDKGQHPGLLANRCRNCDKCFFPKRTLCPSCFEQEELEDIVLDRKGVIYAVTVVYVSSPSGIEAPYAYGYVNIPVNNIRVLALFTGDNPTSFYAGMEVELVLETIRTNSQGQHIIGYKFKPVS